MQNIPWGNWMWVAQAALLVGGVLASLKMLYTLKPFTRLPSTQPKFCPLPKYSVTLPVTGADRENALSATLARYGFRELRRSSDTIEFHRGSELGDFSIKVAKIVALARVPLSDPVQVQIRYGVAFGCAFDTGDLWRFCHELTAKVESTGDSDDAPSVESGNPYQSPRS